MELLDYADSRGFGNLALDPNALQGIVDAEGGAERLYEMIAAGDVVAPRSLSDRRLLESAVLTILRKYVDKFYRVRRERWHTKQMVYARIDERDTNFPRYAVRMPRGEVELVEAVRKLIREGDHIYRMGTAELPGVYFDRHLYQPLLIDQDPRIKTTPPGLSAGEQRFVEDLRARCEAPGSDFGEGRELFLLRNLTRGRGVGFFRKRGFFPDFIVWIRSESAQRVVFVEPHGMIHAGAYKYDDKARLHEYLPTLARSAAKRAGTGHGEVSLDSYIVSNTPYDDLRRVYDDGTWTRERFAKAHIVFPERSPGYNYIAIILGQQVGAG